MKRYWIAVIIMGVFGLGYAFYFVLLNNAIPLKRKLEKAVSDVKKRL